MCFAHLHHWLKTASAITLTARRTSTGQVIVALLPHFPGLPVSSAPGAKLEQARFDAAHIPLIMTVNSSTPETAFIEAAGRLIAERAAQYQHSLTAIREINETEQILKKTRNQQATQQTVAPNSEPKDRDDPDDEITDETDTDDEPNFEEQDSSASEPSPAAAAVSRSDSAPSLLPLFDSEP